MRVKRVYVFRVKQSPLNLNAQVLTFALCSWLSNELLCIGSLFVLRCMYKRRGHQLHNIRAYSLSVVA